MNKDFKYGILVVILFIIIEALIWTWELTYEDPRTPVEQQIFHERMIL